MTRVSILRDQLAHGKIVLLDGASGTEIQRRGVRTKLPLWSTVALMSDQDVVRQIHRDYIDVGADIITTNTFRTNRRALVKACIGERTREFTLIACRLATQAREDSGKNDVLIGGCIAPLEDCYQPELVPIDRELWEEHLEQVRLLKEGDVDFIFIETMNCIREARVLLELCMQENIDCAISFVCDAAGNLLSGESVKEAAVVCEKFVPIAVCTNCRKPDVIEQSLKRLLRATTLPVGIYANGDGHPDDECGWLFDGSLPPEEYLEYAKQWLQEGVKIIGGCCGTNPEYIRILHQFLGEPANAR